MHVLKESIIPSMAFITYEKLPCIDGRIETPPDCLFVYGVYPVEQENAVKSLITNAEGRIHSMVVQEDPNSGLDWIDPDAATPAARNGLRYTENRDTIATETTADEVIVMYSSPEKNSDGEILVDHGLLEPITNYIIWMFAKRALNVSFLGGKRVYGQAAQHVESLGLEYARTLKHYTAELWKKDTANFQRNR